MSRCYACHVELPSVGSQVFCPLHESGDVRQPWPVAPDRRPELDDSECIIAARALRNHAARLFDDNVASLTYIERVQAIANKLDPQRVLI